MSIRKDIKDEYLYSVKDSEIHGKGVFAKENIEKGKKSLACILTDEEFLYSDLGKYINHSKSPNCKLVDDGSRNFLVVTINDINDGDEILVDYDDNPNEFQKSNNLGKDYFGLFNMEEIEDDRIKYRYFWKLDEDIKRIKQLLV
jgi:SET domain-containing protein